MFFWNCNSVLKVLGLGIKWQLLLKKKKLAQACISNFLEDYVQSVEDRV